MKEVKHNLQILINRKELYISFIFFLAISMVQVYLVIQRNIDLTRSSQYAIETTKTAEYLYILYNTDILFNSVIILAFPTLSALIFSDAFWIEKKEKIVAYTHTRLNFKKDIYSKALISFFVSFSLVFISLIVNYLVLVFIFESGNYGDQQASFSFFLRDIPGFFLDSIRLTNPVLFTILSITHVSILCGLLSLIGYAISFYIRNKILLYVQVVLFMIVMEIVSIIVNINYLSIVKQLQIMSKFNIINAFTLYALLFFISMIAINIFISKKDNLL